MAIDPIDVIYGNATGSQDNTLDFLKNDKRSIDEKIKDADKKIEKKERLDRSVELKRKRLNRKGELQYDSDDELIHDSDAMIRVKELANAGIKATDWLLEASENIMDFGQGDAIDYNTGFMAENQGKKYNMQNKDFIAARDTTTEELAEDYKNAIHDPNADKGIYTLRKFDGYNADGIAKYLYKYGMADVGANTRYRDQYVQDGFDIVEEKRFAGAEQWEKTWNASQGVLDERTLDDSLVAGSDGEMITRDEASGINFGYGKSELLNKDLLGTDVDKTDEDYEVNKRYSELLSDKRDAEGWHDNSVWGRTKNTLSGAGSMFTKALIVDTADWLGEISGIGDIGTEEEKRKWTQDLFNYDDHFSKENMAEVEGHVKDMMKNGISWKGLKGAFGSAFANVETTGESLGYLAAIFIPAGGLSKLGKAEKMLKAAKVADNTADIAKYEKIIKNATTAEKSIKFMANQAGVFNAAAGMTNDHIDAFKENNNGVGPTGSEVALMYLNNFVAIGTDKFIDINILRNAGVLKTMKGSLSSMAREQLPGMAGKIAETTVALATNMTKEFAQEYYQTMSEQINKQWGTDKYGNSLMPIITDKENIAEALTGGVAGAGGAVHFQMAGEAAKAVKSSTEKTIDKKNKEKEKKLQEENAKNSIVPDNIENAEPDFVTSAIEKVFDNYEEIEKDGKKIEEITSTETAEPDEKGNYKAEDVKKEFKRIHEKLIIGGMERARKKVEDNADPKTLKLGSMKSILSRARETINKFDTENLSEEDKLIAENYTKELDSFDKEINDLLIQKFEKHSLEEIDAMSRVQLVKEFGNQETTVNYKEFTEKDLESLSDEEYNNLTAEEQIQIQQSIFGEETATETEEKQALVNDKINNTKTAKAKKAKKAKVKKIKATIDNIFEKEMFHKDKGLITRAKKYLDTQVARDEAEEARQATIKFTKAFILNNIHKKEGGDKTKTSINDISDEEVNNFLTKGKDLPNGIQLKKEYFADLNATNFSSLYDINRGITSLDNNKQVLLDSIKETLKNKKLKKRTLQKNVANIEKEINKEIENIKKNGIEEQYDTRNPDKKLELNTNPTKEEIFSEIREIFNEKKQKLGKYKFEINYTDVVDYMSLDKDKKKSTGVFSLLDAIDKEIELLQDINTNKFDDIVFGETAEEEIKKDTKKKKDKEKEELKKATGSDKEVLTSEEVVKVQKEIIKTTAELIKIKKQLSISKDGERTNLQNDIVNTIKRVSENSKVIYKKYLNLKNKADKKLGIEKNIEKELENINNKIEQLTEERQKLEQDARKLTNIKNIAEKNTDWHKRLNKFLSKVVNNTIALVKKLTGINSKIESIDKEIDNLKNKEKNLEIDLKNAELDRKTAYKDVYKEKDNYIQNKTKNDRKFDNIEEIRKEKEKLIKKEKRELQKKLKDLKAQIEPATESARIIYEQSKTVDDMGRTNIIDVPVKISEYAEAIPKAKSLFHIMKPSDIYKSTNNEALKKYIDLGEKLLKDTGIYAFFGSKKRLPDIPEFSAVMTMMKDIDGENDETISTGIALSAYEVFRDKGNKLFSKTDDDVNRMLNRKQGASSGKVLHAFRHLSRTDNFVLDIGNKFLSNMGIQLKKDGDIEAFERLKMSAGLAGLKMLLHEKKIIENNMQQSRYEELLGLDKSNRNAVTVGFLSRPLDGKARIKETIKTKVNGKEIEKTFIISAKYQKIGKPELERLKVEFDSLEKDSIIINTSSTALFEAPKEATVDNIKINNNPYMKVTPLMAKTINNLQQQKHNILIEPIKKLVAQEKKYGREAILSFIGWRNEDDINNDPTLSKDEKSSQIAANIEKESAYDELLSIYKKIDNGEYDNELWFKYMTATNNRLNIDSVLLDPQNEKELHRWLIATEKSNQTYSVQSIIDGTNEGVGFKFGLAQAFKFDIDKKEAKVTLAFADELLRKTDAELEKMIFEDKQYDHFGHALQALSAVKDYRKALKNRKVTKNINGKNIYNSVKFNTTITAEYDGITNGIMLKTLQTMFGDNYANILSKGGFVSKGIVNDGIEYESYESMLEEIDNESVLDVYKTQAKDANLDEISVMTALIEEEADREKKTAEYNAKKDKEKPERLTSVLDIYNLKDQPKESKTGKSEIMLFIPNVIEEINKELRDLFKDPTMTTGYGSAVLTVTRNVARNLTKKAILTLLESANDTKHENHKQAVRILTKIANVHSEFGDKKDYKDLIKELQTESLSFISYNDITGSRRDMETDLEELFQVTVGEAVGAAIKENLGGMIEITDHINDNSRYMFRVFEQALEQELEKYSKGDKALTQDKLIEIIKDLKKFMPIFSSPESTERLEDGIAIFKTEIQQYKSERYADTEGKNNKPRILWMEGDKKKYISSKVFIRKISEAYSSAGVLPTHTEDAVDMSKFVNEFIEKYGITAIHDAIVIGGADTSILLEFFNSGIIDTSKGYSLVNSIAEAMRSIYEEAEKANAKNEYKINLDEMRNEDEIKKGKNDKEPVVYYEELLKFENLAEELWMRREEYFAHDLKVDHMPGSNSLHESKAKHNVKKYIEEMAIRVKRRTPIGEKPILTEFRLSRFFKNENKNITETEKIKHSLDIIKSMTKILNGEC